MTRRRGNILTLIAAMVLAVLTAPVTGCNTTGCTDNRSSLLIAGFYSSTDRRAISIDSLELGGVGAPNDSLLVSANERPSQVYLPLRSRDSETSFCFHYAAKALSDPRLNDTISLWYTSEPYFASEECGAMYRYRVHRFTYTTHLIDSVAMRDSLINNADIESMMIYFRTQK
ncbi:MAG: hypothetical protein K2N28_10060 [Muribaculaceae bacterium]|nr:hypothetical protein [Muribaculaceae bacterium]